MVYVSAEPEITGSGLAILVTEMSALVPITMVEVVELLFSSLGSKVVVLTVAVFVKKVPGVASAGTWTTNVKTSPLVKERLGFVQSTVPLAPTAGVVQVQPAGADSDTNVSVAGSGSFRSAFSAGSELLLVTVIS